MGYECMLILPIILIIYLSIVKNLLEKKEKIVATIFFVLVIMFFFFIYPSPIGIKEKKLYWRGEKYRITTVLDYVEDQLIKFVNIFID